MTELLRKAIARVRTLRDVEQDRLALLLLYEVEASQKSAERSDRKPIWERAQELMKDLPLEELEKLPMDGATEHDHYIYGTPRVSKEGGGVRPQYSGRPSNSGN